MRRSYLSLHHESRSIGGRARHFIAIFERRSHSATPSSEPAPFCVPNPAPDSATSVSSQDRQLEISGGWSPGDCSIQVNDPKSTVVDGNDSWGMFMFLLGSAGNNARLRLHNLTISGSNQDFQFGRGAGVNATGFQYLHGKVEIDRVIFSDHHCVGTESAGCALNLSFGIKDAVVRNSLFHHNGAASAAAIRVWVSEDIQPSIRLHNNTFVNNFAEGGQEAAASAMVVLGSDNTVLMYNNILFHNHVLSGSSPVPDIARPSGAILGKHNNIAASAVTWTPDTTGNRSIEPVFAGRANDYRLRGDSPLRDVGFYAGWPTHGLLELGGGPRVLGPTIDLGAFESDVLFNSGFGD